jgi:hypothetical protein
LGFKHFLATKTPRKDPSEKGELCDFFSSLVKLKRGKIPPWCLGVLVVDHQKIPTQHRQEKIASLSVLVSWWLIIKKFPHSTDKRK